MSSDSPHYQVSFFSQNEKYKCLPDTSFSLPVDSSVENLNAVVNKALESVIEDDHAPVAFEFLIGSSLLRSTLKELVEENGIPTETVILIECILREAPPSPESDISLSDWVGSVKTTEDYIFAATYDGVISCWSYSGKRFCSAALHEEAAKCIDILPNTSDSSSVCKLLSGGHDQVIILSMLDTNEKKKTLTPLAVFRGHERSVECLAASADGFRFVSGSFDSNLKVWNTDLTDDETIYKGKDNEKSKKRKAAITKTPIVTLAGHKDAVVGVSWLPASRKDIATVSWDHSLRLWDLELAGQTSSLPSTKAFTCLAVCPTSCIIVTGSVDPVVRLWDPRSKEGSFVKQSFLGHKGWVSSLSWSPSNDNVFISSSFDHLTKMWDVRSGKTPLYDLKGHTDRILCCDWFYKDWIVSGGVDSTMKVFRTKS